MIEKIKCPNCGSDKLEIYNHFKTGSSEEGKLPNGKGSKSYECQNCGHEFTGDELNNLDRTAEYIEMCSKAIEIADYHFFKPGDYFYVKNEGVNVVKETIGDLLTELDVYPIEDCYWIPTKSQLKDEIKEFISDVDLLFDQFCNDRSRTWHYPHPKIYFNTEEKRLLALFMAERYKKFWSKRKKNWVKDPNF